MTPMLKSYYEDELAFLRDMGSQFARAYPDIARELGLGKGDGQIDVLLQGVAFLTGRIRQSLDAQFPDLLYPLLGHIWPQALRPSPCAVIIEFQPRPNMFREPEILKAGAEVRSIPVDGTSCQFRTAFATPILPLKLDAMRLTAPSVSRQQLHLHLRPLPGALLARIGNHPLRLHCHGASVKGLAREAYGLYSWLAHHLRDISLRVYGPKDVLLGEHRLGREALTPVGWRAEEALLPCSRYSFAGYRHLSEYFLFPPKHLFFDLRGLEVLGQHQSAERFEVCFDLDPLPGDPISPTVEHVRLNCVPAVNLFQHTAMPLSIDGTRTSYLLRPEGSALDHYDIFSVERVAGHVRRNSVPQEYFPFFSFHRPAVAVGEHVVMYQVLPRPPISHCSTSRDELPSYPAVPLYLSFVEVGGQAAELDAVVSVDLLCTNRDLPLRLRAGDINKPTRDIPSTLQFSDLGAISLPAPAAVGGDGLWRFFAYGLVGLNHFADREALRILLHLLDFPARYHQSALQKREALLASIATVNSSIDSLVVGRPPAVLRGARVDLRVHENRFSHHGELALFCAALDRFLAESATANTFTQLAVQGIDQGLELLFPPRVGTQGLIG